jgi:hypothetical protein
MTTVRANVFRGVGRFGIEEVPCPHAGTGELLRPDVRPSRRRAEVEDE